MDHNVQMKSRSLVSIIVVSLFVKFVYLLFGAIYLNDGLDLGVLKRNDSYWYETIALQGHQKITPDQLGKCEEGNLEQSYYAFFPLYPAIVGGSMALTGLGFNETAFFYSLLFSTLLYVFFYVFLARCFRDERAAFLATLILVVFPFHYYFSVFYTEALFLLLLIGSFHAIALKRMFLFAILSSLLMLVRPNGLFMLVPLFVWFLERHYSLKPGHLLGRPLKDYLPLLVFAIPVSVFVLYCAYLWVMTGDFFAYKTAQAGWCRETVFPWVPILRSNDWVDYFQAVYLFVFLFISVLSFRKLPLSFSLLTWIGLLLPLVANSITLPRFISVIFVFPFLFGSMLRGISPVSKILVLIGLFILQLWTFGYWLRGDTFSF